MNAPSAQPHANGPIGIVAALHEEISELLTLLSDAQRVRIGNRDFWTGAFEGQPVVVVLSRVGKVAAATTAAVLITHFGVRAVVFAGVAGALAPGVAVGDVVVSSELLQHDVDASPLFPRWEIPLMGVARFAADAALADALRQSACAALADPHALLGPAVMQAFGIAAPQVHSGLIVSGDRFVCTSAESAVLRHALPDTLAVEMEGAAVAQVCDEWGVPFAAIRTISDRADDTASVDFAQFIAQVDSRYSVAILRNWLSAMHAA
ncbi:5'-methylthioadenosine/adenosylhomocysteine nucleosidase [Ralstonia mannitolilytica]|uniref:adenosylhomocysteine nucleosidase n=1 Tax=Ralstonia mannitolilytica TaxID=105219 RepID=A0AAJ4ZNX8_9RALS|nr:5'-methylthioadenosine/adenosylhomocysteine nucleosidase [Ralstonia mannitolilytica]CAG2130831.1 5'-methylthioadenosine/S-adenosylhomocysteine nucleosidase [Ralstonia mannitolilytica]CAJ0736234.1 5'-methylthioadenosine/S-adenosylhomocysteine nucleosidase [Ralstonia mannitolilytica]SUE24699.1 5'-methylthioadenosine/S-adenosylhomocysteine nucleosidase [Ralstonia mannitolilytica]SUE25396.1 5'-methylthioadenosine/S-adenosylhomocysteine nucleosidase [Ralstonia mannitolilytica]SUE35206.1 5'-methy